MGHRGKGLVVVGKWSGGVKCSGSNGERVLNGLVIMVYYSTLTFCTVLILEFNFLILFIPLSSYGHFNGTNVNKAFKHFCHP